MPTILLYGDSLRYPAIRHELPMEIVDPVLFVDRGGRRLVMTSSLEAARIARALPMPRSSPPRSSAGSSWSTAACRATKPTGRRRSGRCDAGASRRPPSRPTCRWRWPTVCDGITLDVDARAVGDRRRVKTAAEPAGIRRAQRAAEAGMAAAERLIKSAGRAGGVLQHGGEALTAGTVRKAVRPACAAAGAPAPADIIVTSAWSGGGHDPGSGPLPAGLPILVDVWPRDEESGCWADMARTFVAGEPPTHGFCFSLGHGVGLEVHEPPFLGLAGDEPLVAGDVVAIEPGLEGLWGIGAVMFEDLLRITEDGSETLTDSYDV